jgi:hypothetical protein
MSIHTLQDLCYAYSVAEPVQEMLFALQDRIDALEAQRKPLTDEQISAASKGHMTRNGFARAIEAAHNIKEKT